MVVFNPLHTTAQHVDLESSAPQLVEAAQASLLTVHVLQTTTHEASEVPDLPPAPENPPPRWSIAVTTSPCSALHAIHPLYDAMLDVEQLGIAIKERPLPAGEDLCLSGHTCLCVLLPSDQLLTCHVPQLLERVSFAYQHAILLFVAHPPAACLDAVRAQQHRLYAMGRSLGLAVQVVVAHDVPHAQHVLRHCILGSVADEGPALAEWPDEWTACLERAECLNPHSAAAIAATGLLQHDGVVHQCMQVVILVMCACVATQHRTDTGPAPAPTGQRSRACALPGHAGGRAAPPHHRHHTASTCPQHQRNRPATHAVPAHSAPPTRHRTLPNSPGAAVAAGAGTP